MLQFYVGKHVKLVSIVNLGIIKKLNQSTVCPGVTSRTDEIHVAFSGCKFSIVGQNVRTSRKLTHLSVKLDYIFTLDLISWSKRGNVLWGPHPSRKAPAWCIFTETTGLSTLWLVCLDCYTVSSNHLLRLSLKHAEPFSELFAWIKSKLIQEASRSTA